MNTNKTTEEPLQLVPEDQWIKVEELFRTNWPYNVATCKLIENQRLWRERGCDSLGFKLYSVYGDARNGIVAFYEKHAHYEVIIQCPTEDISKLEEALKTTKIIDWTKKGTTIPYSPGHIRACIKRISNELGIKIVDAIPSGCFALKKTTKKFQDVSIPPNVTFGQLSDEHVNLINAKWPHKYPGSEKYIKILIDTNSGYGLFKNGALACWVFINDAGFLGHLFTLEEHRRRGYAELILKLVCNILLEQNKDIAVFCVKTNESACNLYKKLGFENYDNDMAWFWISKNESRPRFKSSQL